MTILHFVMISLANSIIRTRSTLRLLFVSLNLAILCLSIMSMSLLIITNSSETSDLSSILSCNSPELTGVAETRMSMQTSSSLRRHHMV